MKSKTKQKKKTQFIEAFNLSSPLHTRELILLHDQYLLMNLLFGLWKFLDYFEYFSWEYSGELQLKLEILKHHINSI